MKYLLLPGPLLLLDQGSMQLPQIHPCNMGGQYLGRIMPYAKDDSWLQAQLGEEQNRLNDKYKLIQLEENKIKQAKQKLSRIQDGWEKGIYTEAELGVKVKELRQTITNAEQEIEKY